jgi:serine/threonine protein kinase
MVGKTLGHYELISLLGAGGMGEVYRARDRRLGRDVAIKVLLVTFSENASQLHRFEQEARAVGMLNHPNILTIHDIGAEGGKPYIVSELLEGETLRDHLAQGKLPVRQALDYALQTARGLAAAHEKGIVHRDLKPENLFITGDGRVKILDFGLAKLTHSTLLVGNTADASTVWAKTERGVIMGTVGYMSPEQVRGEDADHRSDLFSLGAILYEMLTGKRAFEGQSAVETMNSILKDGPPDLTTTNQNLSPALERLVRHCLEKLPEKRFQSANDLSFAIEPLAIPSDANVASPLQESPLTPIAMHRASRKRLGWLVASMFLLATLVALAMAYFRRPDVEGRAVRSFILPPEKTSFNFVGTNAGSLSISPDGRRLVFGATTAEGKHVLWVRSLDALSAQALTGTEDGYFPFWSPDSRFLGFFADGKLKKIDAAGGPEFALCDAPLARGGTWSRNGVIVFAPDRSGALQQVSGSGGASSAVTQLGEARSGTTHRWAYFLPDGEHFLYLSRGATASESETGAIYVASLASKGSKLLLRASSNVAYAQGYLLFLRQATLMAQAFDAKRLEMVGAAFPVADHVQSEPSMARGVFAVSENGVLAYQTGSARNGSQLAWFDRNGKQLSLLGDQAIYGFPQLSPDGKRVMVTIVEPQNGNEDVWLSEVAHGRRIRFTTDPADETSPAWSRDGSHIAYGSNRKGHFDLYQKVSSGVGSDELLLESDLDKYPMSWSPDGRFLLYYTVDPKTKLDLWVLPVTGDRKPFPFLQTEFNEANGQFSPDGRWITYISDESRRNEVYVAPFPGPGGKQQISTSGGRQPKWRADGKEIFYLDSSNKVMAAEVNGQGARLEVGAVRPLFEVHTYEPGYVYDAMYDATADGQRFLFNTVTERKASAPITLVLNWTADLKR